MSLLPAERAEKIFPIDALRPDIGADLRAEVAAQIKEAVLEAFDNKWRNEHKRCLEIEHDKAYAEGFRAGREECDHESPCCDACIDKFRAQGFNEAKEKAKDLCSPMSCMCAQRIGEMEP